MAEKACYAFCANVMLSVDGNVKLWLVTFCTRLDYLNFMHLTDKVYTKGPQKFFFWPQIINMLKYCTKV